MSGERLLLVDLVLAECVYVLESFYEVERERVAELMRAAVALPSIATIDDGLLLRALEIYELDRLLDFAEAYLVAQAETGWTRSSSSIAASIESRASSGASLKPEDDRTPPARLPSVAHPLARAGRIWL